MRYRRANVTGGTYFFTVNLAERKRRLLVDHINVLRMVMKKVESMHPFYSDAMVVLPDYLHAMWTLPESDKDYPVRWTLIKAGFCRHLPKDERCNRSRIVKGERGIWQRRYWEHLVRDERDYARHMDYIHYSPGKTWLCDARCGLAAFDLSSPCETGHISARLGWCIRFRVGGG